MAFFKKKKWINPAEFSVSKPSGQTSYIKDEYVHDSKALANLCSLVCPSVAPIRKNLKVIIVSAVQKLDTISAHADKFYRAALSSSDVETFFKNFAVVRRDYSEMQQIETYVYYGGIESNFLQYNLGQRFQIEVRHLIDRAYAAVSASGFPSKLAATHLAAFKIHASELDAQSQKKLASKYKKYMV